MLKTIPCFVFSLFVISNSAATTYPAFTGGDAFTGTLTIDPHPPYNGFFYEDPSGLGSLSITIDGITLTVTLTRLNAPLGYGSYSWFSGSDPASLGGAYASLFLYGSTTSTGSVFPEPIAAYSSSQLNFETLNSELVDGHGVFHEYQGTLTSILRVGDSNMFTFSGTVTVPVMPEVPEPSTWAMLLIGFVGLGFVFRYGKTFRMARSLK
jgi:hypothetical protein